MYCVHIIQCTSAYLAHDEIIITCMHSDVSPSSSALNPHVHVCILQYLWQLPNSAPSVEDLQDLHRQSGDKRAMSHLLHYPQPLPLLPRLPFTDLRSDHLAHNKVYSQQKHPLMGWYTSQPPFMIQSVKRAWMPTQHCTHMSEGAQLLLVRNSSPQSDHL